MQSSGIVTGASRGIGRLRSSCRGARVALWPPARSKSSKKWPRKSAPAGGEAFVAEMRPARAGFHRKAIRRSAKEFGRIDVLVNNAGITRDGLAVRMKPEDWEAVLQINLTGAFFASQQVLPGMMSERWGRIINIASVVGEAATPARRIMWRRRPD